MSADIAGPRTAPPQGAAGLPPAATPAVHSGAPDRLAYQPALDGLRGAAVGGVLLFHGGATWARGGYLGVSAFFTLSGFLITSLLLVEHRARGRIDLRRFWSRRARRLLPAAWLALAGIVVYGATVAEAATARALRGDVLSALGYVANWRFIWAGDSYEAIFSEPSPAVHLWSLAIEEQYYVLFPPLLLGLLALSRGRHLVPGVVLGALALGSTVWMLALHDPLADTARVYYGTDTRAAEMLVGAVVAVIWHRVSMSGAPPVSAGRRLATASVGAVGAVALAGMLLAWWRVGQGTDGLYRGGFGLHALATAAVVVAATVPGPVRTVLSLEPLRRLGLVSYGVYLYHWPLFLYLDEARTGLDGAALFSLRVVVTLVVATLSYVIVEQPIRSGRFLQRRTLLALAPLSVVGLLGAAVLVSASAPGSVFAGPAPIGADPGEPSDPAVLGNEPGGVPPRVTLFGDSTALMLSRGLVDVDRSDGTVRFVVGVTELGCGLFRGGDLQYHDRRIPVAPHCTVWPEAWEASLRDRPTDVAVVLAGPMNVADRRFEGEREWRVPGDPVFDEAFAAEIRTVTEVLSRHASLVVWLTMPDIDLGRADVPRRTRPSPESDPARIHRLNELIADHVAELASEGVVIVDFASWFAELPGGMLDPAMRPDGVHLTDSTAVHAARWLSARILEEWRPAPDDAPK